MRDFTPSTYKELLLTLKKKGYEFVAFGDFVGGGQLGVGGGKKEFGNILTDPLPTTPYPQSICILRHDLRFD